MMKKLKLIKSAGKQVEQKRKSNKLPPDTYKPVLDSAPKELILDDEGNNKLVFSVSRKGEDGLPHVDIRLWIQSEMYTGLTKKGINFDSDLLLEVMDILEELREELEEKGH